MARLGFPAHARWPFLWDAPCPPPLATNPGDDPETGRKYRYFQSPLFGLAPGGACHASDVAARAVRSYRTLSPLPRARRSRRFAFCGAFPGVAPAGRYPAPCLRGARTFLCPEGQQPSGRLAGQGIGSPEGKVKTPPKCARRCAAAGPTSVKTLINPPSARLCGAAPRGFSGKKGVARLHATRPSRQKVYRPASRTIGRRGPQRSECRRWRQR